MAAAAVLVCLLLAAAGNGRQVSAASKVWAKVGSKCYNGVGKRIPGAFLRGIDVSEWQGQINWKKVAASNVDFAFIRAFYGTGRKDLFYETNMKSAQQAGIPVGVYFYSRALTYSETLKEAQTLIRALDGYLVSYPVVFDLEDETQDGFSTEKLTKMALVFCDEIRKAGYTPMLYCSTSWYQEHIDAGLLGDVDVWLAQFSDTSTGPDKSVFRYTIWQPTGGDVVPGMVSTKGLIDGIPVQNNSDIDFGYFDYTRTITPRSKAAEDYVPASVPLYQDDGWVRGTEVRYYENGVAATGWKKIDGKYYLFGKDGVLRTGVLVKSKAGNLYYAGEDGARVTSSLVTVKGKTYYFGSNGRAAKGKTKIGSAYYYFHKTSAYMLKNKKITVGKKVYYASKSGRLLTNRFKTVNSAKNGKSVYYFGKDGTALLGLQEIGGKQYFFYRDKSRLGIMAVNDTITSQHGNHYEFGPDGILIRVYKS